MHIYRLLDELPREMRPSAVTVGSFDGIHCAHKELLRRVRERAQQNGLNSVAVTFDPHPVTVLAPEKAPRMLTPLPLKLELLERSGIDCLLVLPFNLDFSRWSPERFVRQVLVESLRAETVFVGENFHFGHRQAGNPQVLRNLGEQLGFRTEILEKVVYRKKVVSSSQIRVLLEEGNVAMANRLLGHPFFIRESIQAGLGVGSARTVPTFNIDPKTCMVPQRGVYISLARLGSELSASANAGALSPPLPSVTNVGTRPTFGGRDLGVETHLLKPWNGERPTLLEVSFLYRLRDERKFDSVQELKNQILRDIQRAQTYFRRRQRSGISP